MLVAIDNLYLLSVNNVLRLPRIFKPVPVFVQNQIVPFVHSIHFATLNRGWQYVLWEQNKDILREYLS